MIAAAALALLLGVSGCGLDAYEKEVDKSQKRIKEFDEADQLLGNPVELPARPGFVAGKLFFRPPVVMARQPDGLPIDGFFYHFPRMGKSTAANPQAGKGTPKAGTPPVVAPVQSILGPLDPALAQEGGFREMYIAFASDGKKNDFRDKIRKAFPTIPNAPQQRKEPRHGHADVIYDFWTCKDPLKPTSVYHIFAHQRERDLVAVVFHLGEKVGAPAVKNAETYSLQSLLLGDEASLVSQSYKERPPPSKPPAL
jgi:hypothetical protein